MKSVKKRDFILDPSLVFYSDFSKRDGSSFISDDAYGHLCTVTGATWGSQGRTFTDGNDWIIPTDNSIFEGMAQLTLEAWVNPSSIPAALGIIGKHWSGTDGSYFLQITNSTTVQFTVINDVPTRVNHTATFSTPTSAWTHLVGSYDGAAIKLFANGEQIGTSSAQTGAVQTNTRGLVLGALDTTGTSPFYGIMGEARIYNRVLVPQEIMRNYLATKWRYR